MQSTDFMVDWYALSEEWLSLKEQNAGTAELRLELRFWMRFVEAEGLTPDMVTHLHLAKYEEMLRTQRLMGNTTLRRYRSRLRSFFNYLVATDRLVKNPSQPMLMQPIPKVRPKRKPFTYDQYEKVRRECRALKPGLRYDSSKYDREWHPACTVAWHTGLRFSDVCFLRWASVDFETGALIIRPRKKRRFREELVIPIDPELDQYLLEYKALHYNEEDISGFVMPSMAARYMGSLRSLVSDFRTICDNCNLPNHSFHSFRHAFVTRLLNEGVDPITIGSMTGQCLNQIVDYSHVSLEAQRVALSKARKALFQTKQKEFERVEIWKPS